MGEESIIGSLAVAPFFNDPIPRRDYYAGNYYWPDVKFDTLDAATAGSINNTIVYIPFVPRYTHTFTGIAVKNGGTGDNGKKIRLGIYASAANGFPGNRLLDAGEITLDATAALREIAISQELIRNTVYWLACLSDYLPSMLIFTKILMPASNMIGNTAAMLIEGASSGFAFPSEAMTYASGLPAVASPAGATSSNTPVIVLKG